MLNSSVSTVPGPALLEQRWEKSLAMFEMWTQIWRDNPNVLARSGQKIRELMMPLEQARQFHRNE